MNTPSGGTNPFPTSFTCEYPGCSSGGYPFPSGGGLCLCHRCSFKDPLLLAATRVLVGKAQPCLHDSCPDCRGTGTKVNGGACIHGLSCPCPKCGVT